jgi:hypothetical protein
MRKKLLMIFYLINVCYIFYAQKYRAFDTTITWHTIRSGQGFTLNCFSDDSYNYYTKGYVFNNGLYWHKIYANVISNYYTGSSSCPPPSPVSTNTFVGYYNNDTLNKKVYFVASGSLTPNFVPSSSNILFDFLNRNISDVFNIASGLDYQINSIDSILFSGKYHKKYNCTTTFSANYSPTYAYVIEGIGSSIGVFESGYNIFNQFSTPVLCFTNTNSTKYFFGAGRTQSWPTAIRDTSTCLWNVTGINKYNKDHSILSIFPNPTSGNINIEFEDEILRKIEITIFNALGQIVYSSEKANLMVEIDLSFLRSGIYYLNVSSAEIKKTIKLIKE